MFRKQESTAPNRLDRNSGMDVPNESSQTKEKGPMQHHSSARGLRNRPARLQVPEIASSKKAIVEIPNSPAGRKGTSNRILEPFRKALPWMSGAGTLQQSEGRERSGQSHLRLDSESGGIAMSDDSSHAETLHPPADHKPMTAALPKGMEAKEAGNRGAGKGKYLQPYVAALGRENERLARELETQREGFESRLRACTKRARVQFQHDSFRIANLQRALEKLKDENENLSRDLESCKDRIFNMLPVEGVADTHLRNQYITLCKTIENWSDSHFGDAAGFIAALSRTANTRDQPNLVSDYVPEAAVKWVEENRAIEIPTMQKLVFFHLHRNLLGANRIFPGLDEHIEGFLGRVIDGLNTLKPAKDKDAILMWKVDLQRSFNTQRVFKDLRGEKLSEIEADIMHCPTLLKELDMPCGSTDPSVCRQIVQEAGELASNIRQSMAEYELDFSFGPREIKGKQVKDFTILDSRTGCLLGSSCAPVEGPSGRVGEFLFLVYPAFVRKATDSSKKIVLVKPTIVVKFDQPVPRGKKIKSSH